MQIIKQSRKPRDKREPILSYWRSASASLRSQITVYACRQTSLPITLSSMKQRDQWSSLQSGTLKTIYLEQISSHILPTIYIYHNYTRESARSHRDKKDDGEKI